MPWLAVFVVAALCQTPARCAEDRSAGSPPEAAGPVACYTFDEAEGTVLKESSGNGNHGRIHGAVYVESPWGHALRLDGKDDYVDLGHSPTLNMSGDLTIEVAVKTDFREQPRQHRLLVGSAAGLAVDRNFNLRLDHHNQLRFEWGDGQEGQALTQDPSFLDGSWRHLVIVVESPRHCYLFVDGRLVAHELVHVPVHKTQTGDVHIGGWSHGFFQGDLDELRIYNRALSAGEIAAAAGVDFRKSKPDVSLEAGYSYHQKAFSCDIFLTSLAPSPAVVDLRATGPGTDSAVAARRLALPPPTRPGSGRWSLDDVRLDWQGRQEGDYGIEAAVLDSADHVVARASARVPVTTPPSWLGSKIGMTDEVLPPYEPCGVKKDHGQYQVSVWGRQYAFGGSPLITSIQSGDGPLLAGPMRIRCVVDGKTVSYPPGEPELGEHGPARVVLEQTLAGPKSHLAICSRVEYDGFVKVDWAIEANAPLAIDQLVLEIPLRPECATLFYSWPRIHSGRLEGSWASRFQPILWIGNEERGLCWVAESDQHWSPADREKAIEVLLPENEGGAVTLRFNFVGKRVELKEGDKLDYTFAIQATPVRPMTDTCWDMRLVRQPPYAHEYQWLSREIEGKPSLQFYSDAGARALLILRWWNAFSYTLPLGHEAQFPKLVEACHRRGLKVVPYSIGFLLSEEAPEYKCFQYDMLASPRNRFVIDRLPGMEPQTTYYACLRGAWQDFAVATTAQCMDQYGIDGVYLDTTVRPHACQNRLHGCGYVDSDGLLRSTYPVFATRELMKRLYAVVTSRKPDGIVDAHVYDCLNVAALAFATSYWNGEQLPRREFKPDALPLDRFRTEFMGHNLGVPADLLYYTLGDYDRCVALAILHDVPVRSENERDLAILSSIWRVREAFGCREAEFAGYWKAGPLLQEVHVEPDGCYASLWRHPTRGTLAAVANLTRESAEVRLRFNLERLGLPKEATAEDACAKKPIEMREGMLSVKLDSQGWTLIWLRPVTR